MDRAVAINGRDETKRRNPRFNSARKCSRTISMGLKAVQFLALMFTALALVPAGGHFFEMPAKLVMARTSI